MIVSPTAHNEAGGPIVLFAISTKYPDPLPPDQVLLPADPAGTSTFLERDCVVVCRWVEVIEAADIVRFAGKVPVNPLRIIAHFFRNLALDGPSGQEGK